MSASKNYYYVVKTEKIKRVQVPQLTIYEKTNCEDKINRVPILSVDYFLKIFCNNFEYDIVRMFFIPDKETYNSLELFNIALASDKKLEQLCKLMEETVESNPKRFRNIIIYAGKRKTKEKIKLKNEEKFNLLLKSISKFETVSTFLIGFEFSSDTFVQLIHTLYCDICIIFMSCKIKLVESIESYQKAIFKSSKIKMFYCDFDYDDMSSLSNCETSELNYVERYISLNDSSQGTFCDVFYPFLPYYDNCNL